MEVCVGPITALGAPTLTRLTISVPSTVIVVVEQETAGTVTVVSAKVVTVVSAETVTAAPEVEIAMVPPLPGGFTGLNEVPGDRLEVGRTTTVGAVVVGGVMAGPMRLPPFEKFGFI